MNSPKTIKGLALATALAAATLPVHASTNYNDVVIFCKGTVTPNGVESGNAYLSVTIPATEGATDIYGNPTTIWNVGSVMAGGVYDSFYNGGPGHFRVQNNGNMPAYVYVSTGYGDPKFQGHQDNNYGYYSGASPVA